MRHRAHRGPSRGHGEILRLCDLHLPSVTSVSKNFLVYCRRRAISRISPPLLVRRERRDIRLILAGMMRARRIFPVARPGGARVTRSRFMASDLRATAMLPKFTLAPVRAPLVASRWLMCPRPDAAAPVRM